jgi:hypothetical protein
MLVGAAKEVSAGAAGHRGSRIVTAVQQPWIGQAALPGLVPCSSDAAARHDFCVTEMREWDDGQPIVLPTCGRSSCPTQGRSWSPSTRTKASVPPTLRAH